MESASILESFAEVGIALAGFGGIAAGLGYRSRGSWSADDQIRLLVLAFSGLLVVSASFLPFVAHHLELSSPFRMAGILLLPMATSGLLYQLWFNRRGSPPGFSRVASVLILTAQLGTFGFLFVISFRPAASHEFGLYLAATLLLLFQACVFFVRLLLTSYRDEDSAA